MLRRLLPVLIPLVALGAWAGPCLGDEVFRLRNGTVLKGAVLEEDAQGIVLRLSGFRGDARVTIEPSDVLERRRTDAPARPPPRSPPPVAPEVTARLEAPVPDAAPEAPEAPVSGPRATLQDPDPEEPRLHQEAFFQRLARVVEVGLPQSRPGQVALGLLLLVGLTTIVMLGGRMAEIESLSFLRATFLALLLGGFLAADVFWRGELLRADRALWVLPAQGVAWLAGAILTLRENPARVVLLFAFVLFSLAMVIFSAGAILVAW